MSPKTSVQLLLQSIVMSVLLLSPSKIREPVDLTYPTTEGYVYLLMCNTAGLVHPNTDFTMILKLVLTESITGVLFVLCIFLFINRKKLHLKSLLYQ